MVCYLALWSRYRKNLLEPIGTKPSGIFEAELKRASGLSERQFYEVMSVLEDRKLITRHRPEANLTFVEPTKTLIWFLDNCKHPRFELFLIDLEDIAYGFVSEDEVLEVAKTEFKKWLRGD